MENLNPVKNPITTITGLVILFCGILLWIVPYIYDLKKEPEWYQYTSAMAVGLLLLVAPDTIITGLTNLFKRKTDSI